MRFNDGMDGAKDSISLDSMNHKDYLDTTLMSHFDVVESFPFPDLDTLVAGLMPYGKHLAEAEVYKVDQLMWRFSGR